MKKKYTVLIVDDEVDYLASLRRSLRKEPYDVITVENGEKALRLLEKQRIGLVVSDHLMPKMDGLTLLKQVHADYPEMLTIMLTAVSEVDLACKAVNEAGVYKFLLKPVEVNSLRMTLQRALEVQDYRDELALKTRRLREANNALKVLLEQSEIHKKEVEGNFLSNVEAFVKPHLEALSASRLNDRQKELVQIVEKNLGQVVSPFIRKLSLVRYGLSPQQIRIANLVKIGKKNREIADIVGLSHNTVLYHRFQIRTKLGIRNTEENLREHLQAFDG